MLLNNLFPFSDIESREKKYQKGNVSREQKRWMIAKKKRQREARGKYKNGSGEMENEARKLIKNS